jgi:superfamily II DNA helicase RecQ
MNIQDKVVKAIIVIQEAGQGLTREQLQAILLGNATEELQAMELDQLESFGIAEGADEEDWNSIIDRAIEEGLLKIKNQKQHTLTYTPEGKKFRKKPHAINLGDGADEDVYVGVGDDELDAVMRNALNEKREEAAAHLTSERSKRQIKLIRAIDRKIALDDFAESENIDLDEVLDDLENMLQHGKRMDITYFTDEVLGKEDVEEVRASMGPHPDMLALRQEWGDVYNEEELRLLRYILS